MKDKQNNTDSLPWHATNIDMKNSTKEIQSITNKVIFKCLVSQNGCLGNEDDCLLGNQRDSLKATTGKERLLPFRLGNGVFLSLPALVGSAKLDRLKLVLWFLYRLPTTKRKYMKWSSHPPCPIWQFANNFLPSILGLVATGQGYFWSKMFNRYSKHDKRLGNIGIMHIYLCKSYSCASSSHLKSHIANFLGGGEHKF